MCWCSLSITGVCAFLGLCRQIMSGSLSILGVVTRVMHFLVYFNWLLRGGMVSLKHLFLNYLAFLKLWVGRLGLLLMWVMVVISCSIVWDVLQRGRIQLLGFVCLLSLYSTSSFHLNELPLLHNSSMVPTPMVSNDYLTVDHKLQLQSVEIAIHSI